jgi:hypothetical protein
MAKILICPAVFAIERRKLPEPINPIIPEARPKGAMTGLYWKPARLAAVIHP